MKSKIICIGLLSLVVTICSGCSAESTTDVLEKMEKVIVDELAHQESKDDPHVKLVKNGVLEAYPNKAIGEAFDLFFEDPKWKYFRADTKEDIVEFTGYCEYREVRVLTRIQFIVDEEKFELGAVGVNEVPQNRLMSIGLFEKIYEPYQKEDLELVEENIDKEPIKETLANNNSRDPITKSEENTIITSSIDGQYFIAEDYINYMTERTDWVTVIGTDASSRLEDEGIHTYEPLQALDNDYSTAWVEGVPGNGEGEWLSYQLEKGSVVQVIGILNGLANNEELYYANNRVKEAAIRFSNGETITMMLGDDKMELQSICLPEEIETNSIDIRIISTYPGTKYDDTCISEVEMMYYHKYEDEEYLFEETADKVEHIGEVIDLDMSLIKVLYEEKWAGYIDYVFEYGDTVYLLRWWEEEEKPLPDFKNGPISIVETGEKEYITHSELTYAKGCELP